jgi:Uma2 family endonuclease
MSASKSTLPTLESGDRLTRAEFHRRYCARPDIKKAELIRGVVYVASPTRSRQHGKPHGLMVMWLSAYAATHADLEVDNNSTVFMGDSEVQPDACLCRLSTGRVRETEQDYLEGAPDLIVEVAASSASYDLHDKLALYQQVGVPEYIVWQTEDERMTWLRLQDGRYVSAAPDEDGVIESEVFPGLRLNVPAMLAGDRNRVLSTLAEH